MTAVVLVIVALAGLGAAGGLALDRRRAAAAAARQRREEENERIRRNPYDWVAWQGTVHRRAMTVLRGARHAVRRQRRRVTEALQRIEPPEWSRTALAVRLLALVVVAVLFVLGLLLNIGIFTALIGATTAVAVAFGIVASLVELLLALLIGHLIRNREPGSPAWHLRLWGALAALAVVLVMVWSYAPARSAHVIEPRIAALERAAADERSPGDGAAPDPVVIAAAEADVTTERERLRRAQAADQTQAILLPAGQVLGFELACDGALALIPLWRKRRLEREADRLQAEKTDLTTRIRTAEAAAIEAVYQRLVEAGVNDVAQEVQAANARNAAVAAGTAPAGPGGAATAPQPAPAPPPSGGIDPGGLHGWSDDGGWDGRR